MGGAIQLRSFRAASVLGYRRRTGGTRDRQGRAFLSSRCWIIATAPACSPTKRSAGPCAVPDRPRSGLQAFGRIHKRHPASQISTCAFQILDRRRVSGATAYRTTPRYANTPAALTTGQAWMPVPIIGLTGAELPPRETPIFPQSMPAFTPAAAGAAYRHRRGTRNRPFGYNRQHGIVLAVLGERSACVHDELVDPTASRAPACSNTRNRRGGLRLRQLFSATPCRDMSHHSCGQLTLRAEIHATYITSI